MLWFRRVLGMNDAEIQSFLGRALTATVSTVGVRNTAHGVPVWYRFKDGLFRVWTDASRLWVRNLRRNPQVSVVVAEHEPPFGAVVSRGKAEVAVDQPGTDEEILGIVRRYLAEEEVADYVQQWSILRTIIRIRPLQIRSWARGF